MRSNDGLSDRLILHGEPARAALIRGMSLMTGLLRPTLGPTARTVAIARLVGSGPPEILDSAATIARRTIQLADPFEDMGAMLVRDMVWQLFERVGDGTATAAVLAQALVRGSARCIAAGVSAASVRRGIERGLAVALAELRRRARAIEGPAEIANVAAGVVRDPALTEMIGEIVDSVGPDGAALVEDAEASETGYEYVDGLRWNEGYVSPHLLEAGQTTARLINPRIFVTDRPLERAEQLLPAVEVCVAAGERRLLVIAPEVRDSAVALLVVNRRNGVLESAVAVRAPAVGAQRTRILEDIAVATGGRCVREAAGERLEDVTIDCLGRARQVWASKTAFGILGGQGGKDAIRRRIGEARAELNAAGDDGFLRDKIRERIGKLAGTAAVIRVGAPTESAREELKLRIEAALKAAGLALQEGVVPGGGAALLGCVPAVEALELDGDQTAGTRVLAEALAEPMRAIAANAGLEPSPIVHEARLRGQDWAFDAVGREWIDTRQAGPVDPLAVVRAALEAGVSAATTAMTAEVLIRRRVRPAGLKR